MNKMVAILDIDGCCLDPSRRIPHLLAGDYEAYARLAHTDKPIPQGVYFYRKLMQDVSLKCLFVTSRTESSRGDTERKLEEIFPREKYDYELLMRPIGNRQEDYVYKLEAVRKKCPDFSNVFIAFDDRPSIVKMWRAHGITAYQTDEGY